MAGLARRSSEVKVMSSRFGRRWAILGTGALLSLPILAGCDSRNDEGPANVDGDKGSVAVKTVDGVGMALVDAAGKTLYFADQESDGSIHCTAACLGFWFPAVAKAPASEAVAGLSSVRRSDNGQDQLTFQGKPLYTFKLDTAPGDHKGHNLDDSFGNTKFTWHAATTTVADSDQPGTGNASTADPDNGYGY
jgi:predicted lipoprotein with Yx(FWY)xxD motif